MIRYRTGNLVRLSPTELCRCGRHFRVLQGGVLGRSDEMITVRGVNVFPSAIEGILREFSEVVEFQGEVYRSEGMDELLLKIELRPSSLKEQDGVSGNIVEELLRRRLSLRIQIELASLGSLPRYEFKARRFSRVPSR